MNAVVVAACAVAAGVALSLGAEARQSAAAAPTAEEIFSRYVELLGGREAIGRLRSQVIRGRVAYGEAEAFPGTFEILQKAPGKWYVQRAAEDGTRRAGSDGETAWDMEPRGGPVRMEEAAALDALREFDLHRDLRWREFYPRTIVHGAGALDGHEVHVIEAQPEKGYIVWFYFDAVTGYLRARERREAGPDGTVATRTYYDDFREVGGVKVPHYVRHTGPDSDWTLRVQSVQHNVPLPDARFAPPAGWSPEARPKN